MPFAHERISLLIRFATMSRCYSVVRKLKSFLPSSRVASSKQMSVATWQT